LKHEQQESSTNKQRKSDHHDGTEHGAFPNPPPALGALSSLPPPYGGRLGGDGLYDHLRRLIRSSMTEGSVSPEPQRQLGETAAGIESSYGVLLFGWLDTSSTAQQLFSKHA
jgi:hypothetical protein